MATGRATRDQEARREVTCLAPKRRRGDGAAERSVVVVVVEKNMPTNARTRYLSWRCAAVDDPPFSRLEANEGEEEKEEQQQRDTSSLVLPGQDRNHGDQV
jgi:hypothetical protein